MCVLSLIFLFHTKGLSPTIKELWMCVCKKGEHRSIQPSTMQVCAGLAASITGGRRRVVVIDW